MTTLREAAQQALAFTMRDFATMRDFQAARSVVQDALRAALAQAAPVAWLYPEGLEALRSGKCTKQDGNCNIPVYLNGAVAQTVEPAKAECAEFDSQPAPPATQRAEPTQAPCDIAEDGVCEVIDCCRKPKQAAPVNKPDALRLADELDQYLYSVPAHPLCTDAAAELRRLQIQNAELTENLERKSVAIQRIWKERDELRKQRGALLEAAKEAAESFELASLFGGVDLYQCARDLRAAIKAAEENT